MAMTPTEWTINALATEFGLDRRTVAMRIRDIPASGKRKGFNVWKLADVVDAILQRPRIPIDVVPNPPAGFAEMGRLDDPFDQGAMGAMTALFYRAGRVAASMAVYAGAPLKVAYAIEGAVSVAMVGEVQEIGRALGLANFKTEDNPPWIEAEYVEPTNWTKLAEAVGEDVDIEAWQAYKIERFGDPAEFEEEPDAA